MLSPFEMKMVDAFILGRVEDRNCAALGDELAAAKAGLPSLAERLDGMIVSKALRRANFNRDYAASSRKGDPIWYRRRIA